MYQLNYKPDTPKVKPDVEFRDLVYKYKDGEVLDLTGYIEISRCGKHIWSYKSNKLLSSRLHVSSATIARARVVAEDPHRFGNWQMNVIVDGKPLKLDLARAVACTWVNGYAKGLTVDHINHDKDNNGADNLQWLTNEDNIRKQPANRRRKRV